MSASVLGSPQSGWIINKQEDLLWFSGSSLLGYACMALAIVNGRLPLLLPGLLAVFIEAPHVYSTTIRVVFDSEHRRRYRYLLLLIVPLCILVPLLNSTLGFGAYFFPLLVWGQYHIGKQHMGLAFLYKRKAGERSHFRLDRYFAIGSMLLPVGYYLSAALTGGRRWFPLFFTIGIGLVTYYLQRQVSSGFLNWPKLLLFGSFIPLQWLAWLWAAEEPFSAARVLAATVAISLGHSFQYLRLTWFHNHNRYADRKGLLGATSRKWIFFFAAVFLLALPEHSLNSLKRETLTLGLLGFLMLHYIMDAKIWRLREDSELAKALRL